MAIYKIRGIILKRQNINEADRILTVYTDRKGKVKMIAKGVRKTLSKLGGHLELFYVVDFVVAEGKTFDVVTGVKIESHFLQMRKNLHTMARVYCFGEMVDVLTHEREEHKELFDLLIECMEYLESKPEERVLDSYFQINLLTILGYRPELYECVHCRGEVNQENIKWDHEHGGILCDKCSHSVFKVSAEAIKVLRILLEGDVSLIERIVIDDMLEGEIKQILSDFTRHLNQKELVSENFLRKVQGECNVELGEN